MQTMRAMQVAAPGRDFELEELPVPKPGKHQLLVRLEACGVCHGDTMVRDGAASSYPRIPGHEVTGVVDEKPAAGDACMGRIDQPRENADERPVRLVQPDHHRGHVVKRKRERQRQKAPPWSDRASTRPASGASIAEAKTRPGR